VGCPLSVSLVGFRSNNSVFRKTDPSLDTVPH
jgi:hypothetical protein